LGTIGYRRRNYAGPHRLPVYVDGTGSAKRFSATVFGAGQACDITDCPQERHGRIHIQTHTLAVKFELDSHCDILLVLVDSG
jgi:hypothetical protein